MFQRILSSVWVETFLGPVGLAYLNSLGNPERVLSVDCRSNCIKLYYSISELKGVDTAEEGGELDHKHVNDDIARR